MVLQFGAVEFECHTLITVSKGNNEGLVPIPFQLMCPTNLILIFLEVSDPLHNTLHDSTSHYLKSERLTEYFLAVDVSGKLEKELSIGKRISHQSQRGQSILRILYHSKLETYH